MQEEYCADDCVRFAERIHAPLRRNPFSFSFQSQIFVTVESSFPNLKRDRNRTPALHAFLCSVIKAGFLIPSEKFKTDFAAHALR